MVGPSLKQGVSGYVMRDSISHPSFDRQEKPWGTAKRLGPATLGTVGKAADHSKLAFPDPKAPYVHRRTDRVTCSRARHRIVAE